MAITAILDLQLKADALDRANEVIHATLVDTRAFPGCLGVTVLVDSADPAHVALYESGSRPRPTRPTASGGPPPRAHRASARCWRRRRP